MTDIYKQFEATGLITALLDSASQAILSVDRGGIILLANRRAEEMFGHTRDELIGANIDMLLPESKRRSHAHQRDEYFSHPRARPMGIGMDLAGRRKDGSEFPVEISLSYLDSNNGMLAIAFVSDISQRKLLEEQLMHAQKMEAVGRLAGGVAHDFNNMLTVITGYNQMMLDDLLPSDPMREYAEEVLQAADRATAITNQLLSFSRRQIMQPRVISLNSVILHTEKMLRRLIGEDVELILHADPNIGNIRADPNHIEQAIVNLAVNSRDAMPTGGRVTIETSNARIDESYARTHLGVEPGEFVMLAVSDTGHGMDSATRQRIFEPFFTTKERGKGTGLGLSTVYGIVKQSGGDIWVYSEPGAGTTFKLYFPRVAQQVDVEACAAGADTLRSDGETVLVVEDEKSVRDLTILMLERLGHKVLAASNGSEAIEVSSTFPNRIALLLTDVVMPNMNGREVADKLSAARPDMRVLFLSGYTESTILHSGVLDSGFDFLPKPFTREALALKIREILARPAS
jgi:two-component system cell cycle sensor histidine kinase/response regulator CckA